MTEKIDLETDPNPEDIHLVCAYCKKIIRQGNPAYTSDGMCDECFKEKSKPTQEELQWLKEYQEAEKKKKTETDPVE